MSVEVSVLVVFKPLVRQFVYVVSIYNSSAILIIIILSREKNNYLSNQKKSYTFINHPINIIKNKLKFEQTNLIGVFIGDWGG